MKWVAFVVASAVMMISCKNGNEETTDTKDAAAQQSVSLEKKGFKKTENGLYYKFEKQNSDEAQVQMGEVLYGEVTIKLDTLTLRTNAGKPEFFAQAVPNWEPKVYEGLLMMHVGDVATFAYEADTLVKMLGGQSIHPDYKAGAGQMIYYTINLQRIVPMEEFQKEQAEEMKKLKAEEPAMIRAYVKENNITAKPTADGLYVIVKEKGNGAKVAKGQEVTVHYTGRHLDGTVFDSSVERGTPFTFKLGEGQVIKGWDKGLLGQTVGTKLQLIIPSAMAYGDGGGRMKPYATLVFDVEIISAK